MSLEFSEELNSPIISPTFVPQDAGEIGLRPKLLSDYTGQERPRAIFLSISKLPDAEMSLWIIHCFTALPVWVRLRWPA